MYNFTCGCQLVDGFCCHHAGSSERWYTFRTVCLQHQNNDIKAGTSISAQWLADMFLLEPKRESGLEAHE